MLKEFKDFIGGGNVVDLAVGVIVGAAMGKIIQSFVDEMIVPLVGLLPLPGDLSNLYVALKGSEKLAEAAQKAGVGHLPLAEARKVGDTVILGLGQFLTTALTVLITAFVVFIIVRQINKMKKPVEAPAPEPAGPPAQEVLLAEIRDLLKK
jgi:large conductance mechanosensitive channel